MFANHTGANAFFVILPLSTNITLECSFPYGVTGVEWVNVSTAQVTLPRDNVVALPIMVTEQNHGKIFICRGVDTRGYYIQKHYTILAKGNPYAQRL